MELIMCLVIGFYAGIVFNNFSTGKNKGKGYNPRPKGEIKPIITPSPPPKKPIKLEIIKPPYPQEPPLEFIKEGEIKKEWKE